MHSIGVYIQTILLNCIPSLPINFTNNGRIGLRDSMQLTDRLYAIIRYAIKWYALYTYTFIHIHLYIYIHLIWFSTVTTIQLLPYMICVTLTHTRVDISMGAGVAIRICNRLGVSRTSELAVTMTGKMLIYDLQRHICLPHMPSWIELLGI
jgi:hypothetical protein